MAAANNSAIRAFLDQRPADMGASSLSSLVQVLKDQTVAADLASNAGNAALLTEVLSRLITVANDATKATAVRVMCLEGLYAISAGASDAVRQGPLFLAVQQLGQSFDDMMEREAEALSAQREMLAVLLLRCTAYTRLKAGDVLQQLCGGHESVLLTLLTTMLRNPTYEWPLMQAALRWLYELTTPSTYFTPETATETTKVHAFQAKVGALLRHCVAHHALAEVFAQLTNLWRQRSAGVLGGLAACASITSVTVLSGAQQRELMQWAVSLRYLSVLVHNLCEFSDETQLVRQLQASVLAESQTFLASVLVPFVMAATHAWERDRVANKTNTDGGAHIAAGDELHGLKATRDPFLNAAIAALRLLRFALYRAASAPAVASAPPTTSATAASGVLEAPLLTALQSLWQLCARLEPSLKLEYPGMVVLLLTVQCGCNVNAVKIRGTPVDLASAFEVLVATVANDKGAIRADSPYATSLAFFICFKREDSAYVETHNESVSLVTAKFQTEQDELEEDEKTLDAIIAMQEQLEYLQAIIMQAALGQLLAELGSLSGQMNYTGSDPLVMGGNSAIGGTDELGNPLLLGRRPSTTTPAESPAAHTKKAAKKAKHPKAYCCQLTGKLMREPVILRKTGHHFEYDALMKVVAQMGHVDPLTGEDVDEEFDVDEGLRQEIADYRVTRAAKK